MKSKCLIYSLVVLLLISGCQPSAQAKPLQADNPQVDQIFAAYDKADSPGCAVGVIQNGQWVYQRAFGMADLETKKPLTIQNVFYIGSNAKQFTAMSILLLLEQGKLSLHDDIHQYLPELPDYGKRVTVENLIHHTSGVKDLYTVFDQKYAGQTINTTELAASLRESDVLELIASQKTLDFAPGDQYAYSNSNYVLLGMIVKRVSGKSLRQFAAENIFKPLGVTHTQFKDDAKIVIPDLAVGYQLDSDGRWVSTREFMQAFHIYGDGGLYTTLDDLYKWDQNFYHNQLGKKDTQLIEQAYSTQMLNNGQLGDYGFGLGIYNYRGLTEIEHGGGLPGYRSDTARFPKKVLTVIELCNFYTDNDSEVQELTPRVADLYLGE